MSSSSLVPRGSEVVEGFGTLQQNRSGEVSGGAKEARERAVVQAEYIVARQQRRNWMDVRTRMLEHCKRAGFAENARYARPVGREKVNGEWQEKYAKGFSTQFANTLLDESTNMKVFSDVTYEDDMMRVVRFGVTDLEKNIPRSREVTFAKAIEKRGRKSKTGDWEPPEGREVISERLNTYGEPVYLVKATDDEMRSKVNAEESKTQRDFVLKFCPRDILEECEQAIYATLENQDKTDPATAAKRLIDRFREAFGLMPSDLEQYLGKPYAQWAAPELQMLRGLGTAMREGTTTFENALRAKYDTVTETGEQTGSSAAQAAVAAQKTTSVSTPQPQPPAPAAHADWSELPDPIAAELGLRITVHGVEYARKSVTDTWEKVAAPTPKPERPKPVFGGKHE